MRRRKRSVFSKERIVMAASSVVILGTLTATGIWLGQDANSGEDYVVDLSTIESKVPVAEEEAQDLSESVASAASGTTFGDDLDYDPYFQETNSAKVENPDESKSKSMSEGAGDEKAQMPVENETADASSATAEAVSETVTEDVNAEDTISEGIASEEAASEETSAQAALEDVFVEEEAGDEQAISTAMQPTLSFGEEDTLLWPIVGNVLLNYSMDETIYFKTLDQYKYNPAIVIAANEGDMVTAAAAGKVTEVFYDAQIGNAVKMDLGNGYEVTYGQLQNILVTEGSYVAMGDLIAEVAAPTKYYSLEGTNVYFMLTKDGEALNPMTRLHE